MLWIPKKQSPDFNPESYQINRVPTAIIYRNNKEIGRIIETPKKTLEKDLFKKYFQKNSIFIVKAIIQNGKS